VGARGRGVRRARRLAGRSIEPPPSPPVRGLDVTAVAGELAAATTAGRFGGALAELVELASDWRVLVSRQGEDKLAIGEFLIRVERASGCEK
jgi:hypothetical protein